MDATADYEIIAKPEEDVLSPVNIVNPQSIDSITRSEQLMTAMNNALGNNPYFAASHEYNISILSASLEELDLPQELIVEIEDRIKLLESTQ